MFEIIFIGTGSGKTTLSRNHSSFLISGGKQNILVDSGDGISKALLTQSVSVNAISGVLISHLHPDHYTGLPSLIVQMKMHNRTKPLEIFIHSSLVSVIDQFLYRSYLFKERMGFELVYSPFELNKELIVSDNFSILARQNSHLDEYEGLDIKEKLSFVCCSFLFSDGERKIFYTGDIGSKEDMLLFEDHKTDVIISELTHISLEDLLSSLTGYEADKIIVTHLSEETEKKFLQLSKNFTEEHRSSIIMAYDGLTVQL